MVGTGQNGPGTADVDDDVLRHLRPAGLDEGRRRLPQLHRLRPGHRGGASRPSTDVNTARTADFTGLPSGWTTPTGGGLHLVTPYAGGRAWAAPTQVTDPDGNVTYTVYNDADHEVRIYAGWDSSTRHADGADAGATREDRAGGYTETLTMSATPHLTGGVPDGTEAISGVQSLSRELHQQRRPGGRDGRLLRPQRR